MQLCYYFIAKPLGITKKVKYFKGVDEPVSEYNADKDSFGIAVSGLKNIFDSGDPILTATSMAGIHIFETSLNMKAQIEEQAKNIDGLKKECDDLKERINTLESHLMDVDRRKQVRRQEDLGPPDGTEERRSGLERRQQGVVITTLPTNNNE